jgi:hypothetical protein
MAIGDFRWYVSYWDRVTRGLETLDFGATPVTIKCALIKSLANGGFDPSITDAWPTWGASGTTNMLSYEVTPGGLYVTGGATCATPTSTTLSNTISLDWSDPAAWAQDAANPTNARWGIFYETVTTTCLGFYDLGADRDMTAGELLITMYNPVQDIVVTA